MVPATGLAYHAASHANFLRQPLAGSLNRRQFMPHLDEGAVWVRATMPYTISYEGAAKIATQIRTIFAKSPMVTEVLGTRPS